MATLQPEKVLSNLCPVLLEELWRIHAVRDGASDKRKPMEHDGRLIGVLEKQLVCDVENHRQGNEAADQNGDLRTESQRLKLLRERVARRLLKDAHADVFVCEDFLLCRNRVRGFSSPPSGYREVSGPGDVDEGSCFSRPMPVIIIWKQSLIFPWRRFRGAHTTWRGAWFDVKNRGGPISARGEAGRGTVSYSGCRTAPPTGNVQ